MSIHIICHMISSVDGKLVSAKWSRPTHPVDISGIYESVASSFNAQGWIVGRTTMAEYDAGVREGAPAQTDEIKNKKAFKGNRNDRALAIVFDPKGKLHYGSDHLSTGEHIVSVLSDNLSNQYLQELRSVGVSYVFQGKGRTALSHALESIEKLFDVKTLLLEGGGIINGAFLEAGLIDELSVLIYPGLNGVYGSDSIIGYQGQNPAPAEHAHLQLIAAQTLSAGMVHLHYRIEKD